MPEIDAEMLVDQVKLIGLVSHDQLDEVVDDGIGPPATLVQRVRRQKRGRAHRAVRFGTLS